MDEYRGQNHFLHVYFEDEECEDKTIAIFHPDTCPRAPSQYDEIGEEYNCDIAHHIREWGYDLYLKDVPEGIYVAQYWATPSGWAGPVAIDADAGIDLNHLTIDEAFWNDIPSAS